MTVPPDDKKLPEGRDPKTGKFTKGNKFRPPDLRSPGRPRKLDSRPILEAIHDEFTPEEIGHMVRRAFELAVKNEEWKGVLEVARFVASYAIGKPVQRSIKATIDPEEFANLFKGGFEDDEGTIDGDYREAD